MISAVFFISHGADRFYYGSYNGEEFASVLKDSLQFNIVRSDVSDSLEIVSLAQNQLRAIVNNYDTNSSPKYWSDRSRYTLWEAEGLEESWVNLQYASWGEEVNDGSASGGKAIKFTGPGFPNDTILKGPRYYQDPGPEEAPIMYTAGFRLKYLLYTPLGLMGVDPPTPVCCILVVDTSNDTILKADTLYGTDFGGGGGPYQTFELDDYTVVRKGAPKWNATEFQIVWYGVRGALYIDYVKVYDEYGEWLMSGAWDAAIMDYVSQDWVATTIPGTEDTVIYRWYVRDEPPSIDYFAPTRHVDSLLKQVSTERIVNKTFNRISKPDKVFCNKRK